MLCMTEEDTDTDDDLREASPLQVSSRRKRKGKKGKKGGRDTRSATNTTH